MIKKVFLLIMLLTIWLLSSASAYAEDMAFSVKAIIPENQINKNLTYFDLLMTPDQNQEIGILINNDSDKQRVINVEVNNARTNSNGVIDYSLHGEKKDKSLVYSLEDLVSNKKEQYTLAPRESKIVTLSIHMPNLPIPGTILGGIRIYSKEHVKQSTNETMAIKNRFAYVIGLQIRENTEPVKPQLLLGNIKPGLMNYKPVVFAAIQNNQPTIIKNLSIDAKIQDRETCEVLYRQKNESMSIAPNSTLNFPIFLDNLALRGGRYTLTMFVESDKGKWSFSKHFEIEADTAKEINQEAVGLDNKGPIIIGLCVILIILVFCLAIYLISKQKKKKAGHKR